MILDNLGGKLKGKDGGRGEDPGKIEGRRKGLSKGNKIRISLKKKLSPHFDSFERTPEGQGENLRDKEWEFAGTKKRLS